VSIKVKPFPTKFEGPEESPGFLLWQVSLRWQREQKAALAPLGLTHVQFVLLAGTGWLSNYEGPITQARLASFAGTDPMMTSQVIRVLEEKGFVARKPDAEDQRKILLTITPAGKKLLKPAIQVVEAVDHALFEQLKEGKTTFTSLLKKLAPKME
jgi:DNA-binding MarR family transcriptional regulator